MLCVLKCNDIPRAAAFYHESAQSYRADLPGFKTIPCIDCGVMIAGLECCLASLM